jgi:hypothetical protein
MRAAHYCSRSRFGPSSQRIGTTMPSADFCRPVRVDRSTLSLDFETNGRSPEVSSTAFRTQPPDLQPVPLMDRGFTINRPLARHGMPLIRFLYIGSYVCSALLSDPASRRRRCASLSLHLHQVVKRTFTSKLSNMLGTRLWPTAKAVGWRNSRDCFSSPGRGDRVLRLNYKMRIKFHSVFLEQHHHRFLSPWIGSYRVGFCRPSRGSTLLCLAHSSHGSRHGPHSVAATRLAFAG